jgi:RNA 2',3'-cyclic 3'-phosphodiesterase
MSETTRTFVAIALPAPSGERLARLQRELAAEVQGCRWVSAQPFHLTMAFLGDVRNRDLNDVCKAVVAATGTFEPFELALEGIGAFPDARKPRVLWAGLSAPQRLLNLRAAVVRGLAQAGHRSNDERFHAHVTLARFKGPPRIPADLAPLIARYAAWTGGAVPVTELVTFASTQSPVGPSYAPLGRALLRGEKSDVPT